MISDTLGDRIKKYESVSDHQLTPKSCLFIRVDGKSFHTWTKKLSSITKENGPFNSLFIDAMSHSAWMTSNEMQGFKIGYVQSDEATFMLTDFDNLLTQGWFDYSLNKVVSVSSSVFTAHFNQYFQSRGISVPLAFFDSRAFIVPSFDAPNVFVWRNKDWQRNSLQMLARSYFSHKDLQNKKSFEIFDMLLGVGVNWNNLLDHLKYGRLIVEGLGVTDWTPIDNYETIEGKINKAVMEKSTYRTTKG